MINYDGDTVWEINPLLAAVTYPVLSPYPHDRLIVNVCGALMELLEYWDHDCDAAAYVKMVLIQLHQDAPLGIRVKAIMKPIDMPNQLRGSFIPGQEIQLQGYLDPSKTSDTLITVEGK
ncbi:hypothetical protein PTTG_26090 [Puccinia triticina 1-1 BBBD Race 1]|uniref:Uncharacterized protein n=1 Tax=Puccinia triticina (isolate 1-1 / race 1 (BBBD)) TaxID=630390 RepID=A0A180GXK4_PUCT1|nr:hypothetical protein PTTG_26090 [Puccinia triticina 1-1 BBBD Race 1]